MAFLDRFKKQYSTKARCFNCGYTQDVRVPKGVTIDTYLKTEAAVCENCGNPTLRRIIHSNVIAPEDARKPIKMGKPQPTLPRLPPLAPRRAPPQRPLNQQQYQRLQQARKPKPPYRPQVQQYEEDYDYEPQEVDYPVDEPINEPEPYTQPDWSPKPKRGINFWTGKEEGQ